MKSNKNAFDISPPIVPIPTDLVQNGQQKQKIKGILFDVYGTLFISGSGDIGIAREQAEEHENISRLLKKFSINEPAEIIKTRFFSEIENTHTQLKQKGMDYPEVEIDKIWMKVLKLKGIQKARKFAESYEMMVNPVYPMPHLKEVLLQLKRMGIVMGIISNAQFYTPILFSTFLGKNPVELGFKSNLLFYSYKFGYAKPSVHMFRKAAHALQSDNIEKESVVYLGNDMLNDILPAKTEGFQTALFAGDKRSLRLRKEDPRAAGLRPDMVITDLIQILDYI